MGAKLVILHMRIALDNATDKERIPDVGFNVSIDNIPVIKDILYLGKHNDGSLNYKETIITPNKPHKLVVSNNSGIHTTQFEFTMSKEQYMDIIFHYHGNEKDENQGFTVELLDAPSEIA